MALVLAPSHPAPLSVVGLRLFLAPDLDLVFPGAAAATLQLAIVLAAIGLWRLSEIAVARFGLARVAMGERGARRKSPPGPSAARRSPCWRSPSPRSWRSRCGRSPGAGRFPMRCPKAGRSKSGAATAPSSLRPLGDTLALAAVSTALALALALAWLESDDRAGRAPRGSAIYIPLLLPQLAFLFGAETFFAELRLDGTFAAVAWAHALFVFPYVMLALSDSWRALDPRYARAAAALGAMPGRTFLFVKLPILFRPHRHRLRDRRQRQRRAVSGDAVRRRRARADLDDRGARACRAAATDASPRSPASCRRCFRWPSISRRC